jgi:hypothetical protein
MEQAQGDGMGERKEEGASQMAVKSTQQGIIPDSRPSQSEAAAE